ncbi:MAG: protoporphyrinogen oxidase [Ignavibacteriaceae bacterium]
MNDKKIVVLGAGISGLTTAYLLHREGFDVTVVEKNYQPGGSMESIIENGYLFDRGPNSGLETTPLISKFVNELNLSDQFIYADKSGNKRYILRDNELHPLPMSPPAFLKSQLFSGSAKLRLLAEPFIGRSEDGYYQSIADFVKRRLGKEFLDYAIDPFVSGVYAGDPEKLSVKSAFPKLYALEENYGSLMIGTIRSIRERKKRAEKSKQSARMFSFKNGMQTLPRAITNVLGEKVLLSSEVISIERKIRGYNVFINQSGNTINIKTDVVLSTIPAYSASNLLKQFDPGIENHLNDIYYPPVLVIYLAYKKSDVNRPLDGFGFLIPSKEKKSFLGAIWSSVIFPERAPGDEAAFTLFVGGARNPEVEHANIEVLIKKVTAEFEELMKISGKPVFVSNRFWNRAIPQYNLGYVEHEKYFDQFEKKNPGLILSGNFRGGISVGDCIKNSEIVAEKIRSLF